MGTASALTLLIRDVSLFFVENVAHTPTRFMFAVALLTFLPAAALAQTSDLRHGERHVGRDITGGWSKPRAPALLEKVRSAVSDSNGQHKIEALRPGVYTVTFTLPGFSVVKRRTSSSRPTSPRRSTPT